MVLFDLKIWALMAVLVVLGNQDVSSSKQIKINFKTTIADIIIIVVLKHF